MNFGLIIIGDEILSGRRQDQHLPKVIELLAQRGQQLTWAQYIGDDRARITAVLKEARASGDVVFSCGGIGATPDDHTRQCAAAAFDRSLVLHPQAKLLIEERMRDNASAQGVLFDPSRPDNVQRLQMGYFPEGAEIIPNPYNKIPGFSVGHLHFVPGFPVMAHPMMEWVLNERYAALAPLSYVERALWVYDISEARLTPVMETVEREHPGVRVFSLPSVDHPQRGAHIELGVKGAPHQVEAAFADMQALVAMVEGGRFELAA
jgi:molybdopterin-biosynthesis enzyme MoeA-like protein